VGYGIRINAVIVSLRQRGCGSVRCQRNGAIEGVIRNRIARDHIFVVNAGFVAEQNSACVVGVDIAGDDGMIPGHQVYREGPLTLYMTDLELSHAELRAALMLAGKQIVKLNFGKKDDPVLPILRRVLRDARVVAKRQGITVRVRLGPKEK